MTFKTSLASIILIVLIACITFAAAIGITYIFPSIGTITETKATIYIEEVPWANGTIINWGNMARNTTYAYNFTVKNTGTTTFNVTLEITEIPVGISYRWVANGTVLKPNEYAMADLELTVGVSAVNGTYSMGTYHVILKEA